MIEIHLSQGIWKYDPNTLLGKEGGFGSVFAGSGNSNDSLAIKKISMEKSETAHRELRMAYELGHRHLKHVMPVLDAGQDTISKSYFIVMPRAEKNLRDELRSVNIFNETDAIDILRQIATGLQEVSDIVHRDLKPENILYHDKKWKIADFGISRFSEESTSLNTLKGFLTFPYAASEQWALERAVQATDIYALGCIAYELLKGSPPFSGPSMEDYSEQHRHAEPPSLDGVQPQLRAFIVSMLRKHHQTRPTLEQVMNLFSEMSKKGTVTFKGKGFQTLAEAGAIDAEASARADINSMAKDKIRYERGDLADNALYFLKQLAELFYEYCKNIAPSIKRTDNRLEIPPAPPDSDLIFSAQLGTANIEIRIFNPMNSGYLIRKQAFKNSGWDVIVGAIIKVVQRKPNPYERSANLWYTNLGAGARFRWWEVTYGIQGDVPFGPQAVNKIIDADMAALIVPSQIRVGEKPRAIDDENADDFFDRWAEILGKASLGQLSDPSHLR